MSLRRVLLSIGLGALAAGLPARSEVITDARSGSWSAYSGVANDGKRVCGVGETGADGRTFNIKYFENADSFEIVIGKPAWAIPRGTRADVAITFDRATPWRGTANGNGTFLFLSLPLDRLVAFEAEFKAAYSMIVTFPGGTEAPWRGDLIGSTAISGHMAQCIRTLVASGAGPSGPIESPRGTQPFGTPSLSGQPFVPTPAAPEFPSVKGPPIGGSVKE